MIRNIKYELVDTAGQITAVIFSEIKRTQQSSISKKLMNYDSRIEQVVFIERNRIQTMGNELCINGSLAGAYLSNNSVIEISGLNKPIKFLKRKMIVSAQFPSDLLQSTKENIIQLAGIVYVISNNKELASKAYLAKLAKNYNLSASGIVYYKKDKIKPLIYVKATNTLVWENACGSGSLAYSIYSGISKIKQPSNKYIEIEREKKYFTIKVQAKIVK